MGLGNLVAQAVSSTSLKKILQDRYNLVEEAPWLTVDSRVRGSKFPEICPREEVLIAKDKLIRKRTIDPDFFLVLEIGKALHHQLQNSILPGAGVLFGEWECTRCGKHFGVKKPNTPADQYAVRRPDKCDRCENLSFQFHEYHFVNDEFRIDGHADGMLSIPGMNGLGIIEGKSISAKGAWQIRNVPQLDHVIQTHIYLWLSGLQWAKIVYWDKATFGMAGLVEHTIERDEETIERIKQSLRDLWSGLASGVPPLTRVCANAEAPRAKNCLVCKPCFETPAEEPKDE